jgi:RNA polymerase sigma factor (sigma-70 family)
MDFDRDFTALAPDADRGAGTPTPSGPSGPGEAWARSLKRAPRRAAGRAQKREVARRAPGPAESLDARSAYLQSIQDVPVLSRERVYELTREMRRYEAEFEREVLSVPGVALLFLERWRERRDTGRVTAALSRYSRDGKNRDLTGDIDARFLKLERMLDRGSESAGKVAKLLSGAELAFPLLLEVYGELRSALEGGAATLPDRRRLGLTAPATRAAVARAREALVGYHESKQTIAHHNLRLVVKCARRFSGLGIPFMDLVQEGNLGLIRAVEKFDPDRGFMFSTYAVWWIQQAMIRALQNQRRTVRVPSHVCELQVRMRHVEEDLSRRLGREPEPQEVARALDISREQHDALAATLSPVRSIHSPVAGLEDVSLEDTLSDADVVDPGEGMERQQLRDSVDALLANLDSRERKVLHWRFGLSGGGGSVTLGEIGKRLGLSRERVRQIEVAALARLREHADSDQLREVLELD